MSEELYGWNAAAQQFISLSSGQAVAKEEVMQIMRDRLAVSFDRMKAYSDALANGTADVSEWQQAMMVELRRAHTQMAALGSGGWDSTSQAAFGEAGSRLKYEYQYLDEFAKKVAAGELSEAEIQARIDGYGQDAWGSFFDAQTRSMEGAGFDEEMYNLEGGAQHCEDCEARAGHWEPISSLPDIGDTQCGSRDKCTKSYRNSVTGQEA